MIAVVDYGVNNVKSVLRAFAAGGHPATLITDPAVVRKAERILVPGVGHFKAGVHNLATTGLGDAVRDAARAGTPVMGICLGLQLLFAASEEAPGTEGLALLPGQIRLFTTSLPVPHVGWARVDLTSAGRRHSVLGPLFCDEPQFFYHVHSYYPADLPEDAVLGTADYDGVFPTIVGRGNVMGAQFHPEKSQRAGIELLSAFARWQP